MLTAVITLAALSASTASAFGASSGGTSGTDPGIGSPEALAAENCDSSTQRLELPYYASPPCVKPWNDGDDNGGATAPGVTKDSIKVVVTTAPLPADSTPGNVINQATGQDGDRRDATVDMNEVLAPVFQTWGRTVELQFLEVSGDDEAAQRADAVKAAAMKPFAVLDFASLYGGGGGIVFRSALAGKVPIVNAYPCCGLIDPTTANQPIVDNAAEWTGKALVGKKAKWAGDESLHDATRKFGVIHPAGDQGVDLAAFTKEFARYDGKVTASAAYDLGVDVTQRTAEIQEQAPTIIAKLKTAGVTTVVNFGDGPQSTPVLMEAATAQDYFPEWIVTGFGYQDIDVVARLSDQEQMAHAFGLIWFVPWVDGFQDPSTSLFQWYWGTDQGTQSVGANSLLFPLYIGIQLAGPKLTEKSFMRGLKAYPPTGGAFDDHVSTVEYSFAGAGKMAPRGSAIAWYDPDLVGPSQIAGTAAVAAGKFLYINDAKRYVHNEFPKGEPKLFDEAVAIGQLPEIPADELVPDYPCDDCPVNGGGPAPSSSAS